MSHVVIRRCVHCRHLFSRSALIHVTVHRSDGSVTLFWPGQGSFKPSQQQGRSAYICRNAACLQPALKANKLQKALKWQIPGDIVKVLSEELEGLRSGDTV